MHEHDADHHRTIGRIYTRPEAMARTARLGAAWAAGAYCLGVYPELGLNPPRSPANRSWPARP